MMTFVDYVKVFLAWFVISLLSTMVLFGLAVLLCGLGFSLHTYRMIFWTIFFGGSILLIAAGVYEDCSRVHSVYQCSLNNLASEMTEPEAFKSAMRYATNVAFLSRFICERFRRKTA